MPEQLPSRMKVRVTSQVDGTGRCWMFDVHNQGSSAGFRVSGVRSSWGEALAAGCTYLSDSVHRKHLFEQDPGAPGGPAAGATVVSAQ